MMLEDGRHEPNLCVVHRVCTRCMDLPMEEEEEGNAIMCDCGRERKIFKWRDTLEQFGSYLFAGRLRGCICIAHNSSGYDSHFVLDFVHRKAIDTGKNHVFTVLCKLRINDAYIRAVNLVIYMYLHWIYCPLKDSKYSRY